MLIVRPLDAEADRTGFDCGESDLNGFLRKTARQHREKGISNTFVITEESSPGTILGYFTLAFIEVSADRLPPAEGKKLPRAAPLPAALLARLAVEKRFQGKGIGSLMVADALKRILTASIESGGVVGLFVDAKDELAVAFYRRFGFIPLTSTPRRLFLPLETLKRALATPL